MLPHCLYTRGNLFPDSLGDVPWSVESLDHSELSIHVAGDNQHGQAGAGNQPQPQKRAGPVRARVAAALGLH